MKYPDIIKSVLLFEGIEETQIGAMLECLGVEVRCARKEEVLLLAGDKPRHVGIVLTGLIHVLRDDYDGNRSLLAVIPPGGIFAEALCCAGVSESPVTVMAGVNSEVMLLGLSRILRTCPNACPFHRLLIGNMLKLVAVKNLQLQSRMEIISLKTIRARVTRYLESFAQSQGREIIIPLSREELADFLSVERSALSHELMRMKKDGLLDYKKNRFVLYPLDKKGKIKL